MCAEVYYMKKIKSMSLRIVLANGIVYDSRVDQDFVKCKTEDEFATFVSEFRQKMTEAVNLEVELDNGSFLVLMKDAVKSAAFILTPVYYDLDNIK